MSRRIIPRGARLAMRLAVAAAVAGATLGGHVRADDVLVTTRDGRVYRGELAQEAGLWRLRSSTRDVLLSPAICGKPEPAPPLAPEPTYRFNEGLFGKPPRGTIGVIVRDEVWGPLDPRGVTTLTLTDPKLGRVTITMALTRAAPDRILFDGVDYSHSLVQPLARYRGTVLPLVLAQTPASDLAATLKAARFCALAGEAGIAQDLLARAAKLSAAPADLATINHELALREFRYATTECRRVAALDHADRALAMAGQVTVGAPLRAAVPAEVAAWEEFTRTLATRPAALKWVQDYARAQGATLPDLTPTQALRLRALLAPGDDKPPLKPPPALLPKLTAPWATALAGRGLDDAQLQAAVDLAGRTGTFFRQEKPDGAAALAEAYVKARLPGAVKVALLTRATAYDQPAPANHWERVEFPRAEAGKSFHYYLQVPTSYRPDTPCPALVALHGHNSTATACRALWGAVAERHGLILISPEYVYGRPGGYAFSTTEHDAVVDSLRHAARTWNLDPARVGLTGLAQGGVACWDIGIGMAGEFAAVVPITGLSLQREAGLSNLLDTALYAVDGSDDGPGPRFTRKAMETLAKLGADATYVEFRGRAHEEYAEEYEPIARWLLERRRDASPAALHLAAPRYINNRRAWLKIAAAVKALPETNWRGDTIATIEATFAGNLCKAEARNVSALRVYLDPTMVDFGEEVRVQVNFKQYFRGRVEPDWQFAIEDAFARGERQAVYLGFVDVDVR